MSRRYLLMVGGDLLLAMSLLVVVNVLLISTTANSGALSQIALVNIVTLCLLLIVAKYTTQLYSFYKKDKVEFEKSLFRIATATFLPVVFLATLYTIGQQIQVSTDVLRVTLVLFCLVQCLIFYRLCIAGDLAKNRQNILIFGSGPMARQVAACLNDEQHRLNFCGYIQPKNVDEPDSFVKGVEYSNEILTTIRDKDIAKIVVALSERRGVLPVRDMLSCKLRGVEVVDAVTFYEKITCKLMLEHIKPGWFVFSDGFLITRLMFMKQRVVDVLASAVLLLLTLPFFPLIALAIRIESPGEIFFRQTRVGFKEKPFEVIKFRTMCANAEKDSGAVWAQENDARVTRLGRLMRKTRIDELPQLFNVLKGEMSFIGPRPERPEFVALLNEKIPYYSRRHSVRPGLTGWAQIKYPYGASEEDALEKLRYDLYFIKNFSLGLEMKIILGTFKVVLFGKGGR